MWWGRKRSKSQPQAVRNLAKFEQELQRLTPFALADLNTTLVPVFNRTPRQRTRARLTKEAR